MPKMSDDDIEDAMELAAQLGFKDVYFLFRKKGHKLQDHLAHKAYFGGCSEIIADIKAKITVTEDMMREIIENHYVVAYRLLCQHNEDLEFSWTSCLKSYNYKFFFQKMFTTYSFAKCDKFGKNIVVEAAKYGTKELVQLLIDCGIEYDIPSKDTNHTAFIEALLNKKLDIAELLARKGATIDTKDETNTTPLMIVCEQDNAEVATFLLDNNANIDAADFEGKTSLMRAIAKRALKTVNLLITRHASVNAVDKQGLTALHYSCKFGYAEITKLLIDNYAKIELADFDGYTPIFHACMSNDINTVQILLENGAEVNKMAPNGEFPLRISIEQRDQMSASLIINSGIRIDYQTAEQLRNLAYHNELIIIGDQIARLFQGY